MWNIGVDDVQEYWNVLENKLINIVDEIVPLKTFEGHVVKEITPKFIKNKINKRNRLLKCFKRRPSIELKTRISNLNFEIRTHFFTKKRFNVRKGILPNNSKTLWHAVKVAKNVSESKITSNMSINNIPVSSDEISDRFAEFFERKVLDIVSSTKVNQNVHNGSRKIYATYSMFMTRVNIKACIKDLKLKKH